MISLASICFSNHASGALPSKITSWTQGGGRRRYPLRRGSVHAGIRPTVQACRVTRVGYDNLAGAVAKILARAIQLGGTTLRDFIGSDGQPGCSSKLKCLWSSR